MKVYYYQTNDNRNPVKDFLNSLEEKQKAKILRIIQNIEEYGLQSIIPHVKKLTGIPLWEIRVLGQDSIRVLYVVLKKDTIYLLHGFKKKSQNTPKREIETALTRIKIIESRTVK